jgi:cholesterol oxidase
VTAATGHAGPEGQPGTASRTGGFDVIVVGSGFGGSVAALRLVEKGYRVAVIEAGRRFDESTYPKTSWNLRRFLWAPRLGCHGIQRIHLLRNVVILAGAGVGGGSLVYANTLYEPLPDFYADPQWSGITDWQTELAPFYEQAKRMLGVVQNPTVTPADELMRSVAEDMKVGETFRLTPVGVYFGEPGREADDPYFGGAGPRRAGCLECGACMTGCRHNAKNTLTKNYLYLAEQAGAVVIPDTTVVAVRPGGESGYVVEVERTSARPLRRRRQLAADHVVLAAGAYGTQRLLHRMRDRGILPRLSPRLGALSRTNSESIVGVKASGREVDYSRGVAITSSFHPDARTHVEPVRYGHGSNAMGLLQTVLVDGGGRVPRWMGFLGVTMRRPISSLRAMSVRHWSERTVIALVMQSLDNSITVYSQRGWLGRWTLTSKQGHGEPNPTWIPAGNEVVRRAAAKVDGWPGGSWGELLNIPLTAHFIGGCVIGEDRDHGVVDPYHRVYGHPGLHVVDGAAVSANLGVNPSLTITAQAERAMAFWPNRGESDPRPPLGSAYQQVDPVAPAHPAVPAHAPAALHFTPSR